MTPVRVVDSITELQPADAGCFVLSGSHGGLNSARYALAPQVDALTRRHACSNTPAASS
jgi:hypothetical protein